MSVSDFTSQDRKISDQGVLLASTLGVTAVFVLMGWCLFTHVRPNMVQQVPVEPIMNGAEPHSLAPTPSGKNSVTHLKPRTKAAIEIANSSAIGGLIRDLKSEQH